MANPTLASIVALKHYRFTGPDGIVYDLSNKNLYFLNTYPGAIGIKTGFTDPAGFCVAEEAVRGRRAMLAVVMNGDQLLSDRGRLARTGASPSRSSAERQDPAATPGARARTGRPAPRRRRRRTARPPATGRPGRVSPPTWRCRDVAVHASALGTSARCRAGAGRRRGRGAVAIVAGGGVVPPPARSRRRPAGATQPPALAAGRPAASPRSRPGGAGSRR